MKIFLALLLMLTTLVSYAQLPALPQDKPQEQKLENFFEMKVVPLPIICGDNKGFTKFINDNGLKRIKTHGKSLIATNATILFYLNDINNEFAVVRTDGVNVYCIIEYGDASREDKIGPL